MNTSLINNFFKRPHKYDWVTNKEIDLGEPIIESDYESINQEIGIDFNFADLIVRERKENGNFKNEDGFSGFQKRMNERMKAGRVKITSFGDGMFTMLELDSLKKIKF